jgi:hypothetical protein
MVGAQRPTVSLALKELADRGSLIRQDEDWLILDPPPEPRAVELEPPRLVDVPREGSAWSSISAPEAENGRLAQLRDELARLRQKYAPDRAAAHELADEARQLRTRTHALVFDAHLLTDATQQERAASALRNESSP